jgi:hypothetical protein
LNRIKYQNLFSVFNKCSSLLILLIINERQWEH